MLANIRFYMKTITKITSVITLAVALPLCATTVQAQVYTPPVVDDAGFGRFGGGWECARASTWGENRYWRDKRPDTVYTARTGNPTQRSTVDRVKRCMARFNLSSTAQRDILGYLQAMLASENEAQADAAAAKLVGVVSTAGVPAKSWALYQIVDTYLDASQPKLQKAEKHIAMLDAMGAPAAVERMLAHYRLANSARFRDSIPLWERELNAALAAHKQITGDTRREYAFESADVYLGIADLNARKNDPQSAVLAVETARAELVPLRQMVARYLQGAERPYTMMGQPAPPVQATQWFNTNGNNLHPAPGKPALLVFASHSCGNRCYPGYAVLRRLRAKFESKGLDIVIMTRTQGFYRNRLVKPDSEMVFIGNYFAKQLDLPVPLAVWQSELGRRDDGKITILSAPNDEALRPAPVLLPAYIVDKNGSIRLISSLSRTNEAVLEDVIASVL